MMELLAKIAPLLEELLEAWARTDPRRKRLHLAAAVPALAALGLLPLAGRVWWAPALLLLVVAFGVLAPESGAGLVFLVTYLLAWLVWVPPGLAVGPLSLLAALLLLTYHVLTCLAGHRPLAAAPARASLTLWARRTGAVAAATLAAWVLMVLFAGAALPAPAWAPGAVLLLLAAGLLLSRRVLGAARPPAPPPGEGGRASSGPRTAPEPPGSRR